MSVGSIAIASSYVFKASSNCFFLYSSFPSSFLSRASFAFSFLARSSGDRFDQSSSTSIGFASSSFFLTGADAGDDEVSSSSPPCPIINDIISIILGSDRTVVIRFGFCWTILIFDMTSGSLMYLRNRGSIDSCAIIAGLNNPPPSPPAEGGASFSFVASSIPFFNPASSGNFSSPSLYAAIESLYRFNACNAAPFREYPFGKSGLRPMTELASSKAFCASPFLRYAADRFEK
mmetsp:Transcript_24033/g.56829  ORF Transcript_24033/g.56829 Transcript_24033/m.56829 type:complete len:233 (-) Transcript_24033:229-927(-)